METSIFQTLTGFYCTVNIIQQGNILDLILTNLEINLNLTDCTVHSDLTLFPSDHFAITFDLNNLQLTPVPFSASSLLGESEIM